MVSKTATTKPVLSGIVLTTRVMQVIKEPLFVEENGAMTIGQMVDKRLQQWEQEASEALSHGEQPPEVFSMSIAFPTED